MGRRGNPGEAVAAFEGWIPSRRLLRSGLNLVDLHLDEGAVALGTLENNLLSSQAHR